MKRCPDRIRRGAGGLFAVVVACAGVAGCPNSPLADMIADVFKAPPGPASLKDTPLGAIFTTPNYPSSTSVEISEAFDTARRTMSFVSYIWSWQQGEEGYVEATRLVEAARERSLDVLLQFSPQMIGDITPPPGLEAYSFNDPVLQERYLNDIAKLASLKPKWLIAATEIDLLVWADPNEYDAYTRLYARAYNRIKEVSPQTQVGVSYHYGVMFMTRRFDLAYQMGRQDFIGLTSYPDFMVIHEGSPYTSPADIPVEYYDVLRRAFPDQPIGFAELGWTTSRDYGTNNQMLFVNRLPEFMSLVKPAFVCWASLYDSKAFDPRYLTESQREGIYARFGFSAEVFADRLDDLNNVGLLTTTGEPKPAFFTIQDVFGVPDRGQP